MPLQLLPLLPAERELYFRVCYSAFVPGIMELMYPQGYSQAAQQHSVASTLRADIYYPGRAHFLKVVDTDLPDSDAFAKVVGVSQWKIFPHSRSEKELEQESQRSENDDKEFGVPPGLKADAIGEFADMSDSFKKKHMGREGYLYLQAIGTRPNHERRGIAALALAWGVENADKMGLPAYLDSSEKGVELYKRWGFEAVDVLPFDATKFGYHDPLRHVCMLRPARKQDQK